MVEFFRSLFGKKEKGGPAPEEQAGPEATGAVFAPIHVTGADFEEQVLSAPKPALVDFWAPWCGPCRMVAPVVEELARTYGDRAVFAKVNTDENVPLATELGIMGIPTLILFKEGREVDRVVGFAPRHVLEEKLKTVLGQDR